MSFVHYRQRQNRAKLLAKPQPELQKKIAFAGQFAKEKYIEQKDVIYSTERDLLEQEFEQAEWQKRLGKSEEE